MSKEESQEIYEAHFWLHLSAAVAEVNQCREGILNPHGQTYAVEQQGEWMLNIETVYRNVEGTLKAIYREQMVMPTASTNTLASNQVSNINKTPMTYEGIIQNKADRLLAEVSEAVRSETSKYAYLVACELQACQNYKGPFALQPRFLAKNKAGGWEINKTAVNAAVVKSVGRSFLQPVTDLIDTGKPTESVISQLINLLTSPIR